MSVLLTCINNIGLRVLYTGCSLPDVLIKMNLPFTPSVSLLRKQETLPELSHQTPLFNIIGHRWRIRLSLHLVLGLPCPIVHSLVVHAATLTVHMLSLNHAMCNCSGDPGIPLLITLMLSFTPVSCRIQVLCLWVRRVMTIMLWVRRVMTIMLWVRRVMTIMFVGAQGDDHHVCGCAG